MMSLQKPLALLLLLLRVAAISAWLVAGFQWSPLMAGITAVLVSLYFPLISTVAACIGAVKAWSWPVWVSVLVFLPGVVLALMAIAGVGAASAMAWHKFKGFPPRGQRTDAGAQSGTGGPSQPRGDTIEGEVISSRVDPER